MCCALYIMSKNTINDSSDILHNDFGKNTHEIRPKKTENRKVPFPAQVGYAVQKELMQRLWKFLQERNGKSYKQDFFFSSLLQKSSDCDRPYLDNSSALSVSERHSGPWRSWSGCKRGRGRNCVSAVCRPAAIYFHTTFFPSSPTFQRFGSSSLAANAYVIVITAFIYFNSLTIHQPHTLCYCIWVPYRPPGPLDQTCTATQSHR